MPLDATGARRPTTRPLFAQVVNAFERVGPAVVHVIAFGADWQAEAGVRRDLHPRQLRLTNAHVVAGAARLRASFTDGQALDATGGRDPATDTAAVLRLSAAAAARRTPAVPRRCGSGGCGGDQPAGLPVHRHAGIVSRQAYACTWRSGAQRQRLTRRAAEPGNPAPAGERKRAWVGINAATINGAGHLFASASIRGVGGDRLEYATGGAQSRLGCRDRRCRSTRCAVPSPPNDGVLVLV